MNQLQSVSHWIDEVRQRSALLDSDADALHLRLAEIASRQQKLAQAQKEGASVALYGHSQAAKAHLLTALCGNVQGRLTVRPGEKTLDYFSHINPGHALTRMALRFTHQPATPDEAFPLRLALISEAELVQLFIVHAREQIHARPVERTVIEARLHTWRTLRQSQPVPGLNASDVAAIAHFWRQHTPAPQQQIDDPLWQQFADLLPALDLSTRASAWSLLWGEQQELTRQWLALAHVLHQTGNAREVAAPLSLLVDQFALPADGFLTAENHAEGEVVVHPWADSQLCSAISLPISTLSLLTCELILPCEHGALPQVDVLDIPATAPQDSAPLWVSKVHWLLERYRQHLQPDVLVVCNAVATRGQTPATAKMLRQWVDDTQASEEVSLPGLVWAITPQDDRFTRKVNVDESVQLLLGKPGQRWGTLQALDAGSVQRLLEWLSQATSAVRREARLQALATRYHQQLQTLMQPWRSTMVNNHDAMIKELQRHAAQQGDLLDGLLPDVTLFESIWQVQLPREEKVNGLFNEAIDLFAQDTTPATSHDREENIAQQAHRLWVQHLRQWSRQTKNAPGLSFATLQQLADCLIVTSYRLDLVGQLQTAIQQDNARAAQLHAVMGNFIAWLGYADAPLDQRPASRIASGSAVFAANNANSMTRLDSLAEQPVHAATRYVYDWLVALYTRACENERYQAAQDVGTADRERLEEWLR